MHLQQPLVPLAMLGSPSQGILRQPPTSWGPTEADGIATGGPRACPVIPTLMPVDALFVRSKTERLTLFRSREHDARRVLWLERKYGLVLVDAAATVAPHAIVSE